MASPSRTAEREEERRLNARTLVFASIGSAAAALLTSQLWIAGTWIAAALTPVIVALVSELLQRPTERIARRVTSERAALLPEAGGAAPPADPNVDLPPARAREDPAPGAGLAQPPAPGSGRTEPTAPIRVYRSGAQGSRPATSSGGLAGSPGRRRKIAYGVVFGTAALAFVIVVVALTAGELIAGGSIGKNDGRTTLLGGKKDDGKRDSQAPQDTAPAEEAQPEEPQTTAPEEDPAPPEDQPPPADEPSEEAPPGEPLPEETAPAPPVEQP